MARYNIYGHVLYSEIQYEELMFQTEKIFIRALMNKLPSIKNWTNDIWNDIDHEYMINTLEEIKKDVIDTDTTLLLQFKDTAIDLIKFEDFTKKVDINGILEQTKLLPETYEINPISKFKNIEQAYGSYVSGIYDRRIKFLNSNEWADITEYLSQQIENFSKIENRIPYRDKTGQVVRRVTPSTYLSMLYNVNLTRTAWNQTFKDANYFNKDLVILETHRNACPLCAPMQGRIYSLSGKSRYDSVEEAYSHGVGHPNCKCVFSIYWDKEQLQYQYVQETKEGEYEIDQKKKAIEREIRKQTNNMELYNMIGNQEQVDKCYQKIEKLKEKL
jgi:hypothetical protein